MSDTRKVFTVRSMNERNMRRFLADCVSRFGAHGLPRVKVVRDAHAVAFALDGEPVAVARLARIMARVAREFSRCGGCVLLEPREALALSMQGNN